MHLTGLNFIGNKRSGEGERTFRALNPATNSEMGPVFHDAAKREVEEAVEKAAAAFPAYSNMNGNQRADFLDMIAEEIIDLGDALIKRCNEETALPEARLTGERGRTVNQLRLFVQLLREGSWIDTRIDTAAPERQPVPKPDVRSMQTAIGPVAVFGSSNFPLAFSVAGGDTASALAAGCTVIFKAHPAHPGTCEMIAGAILNAVKKMNLPEGVFSMLHGLSTDVGMSLVTNPLIKAVGFTGSFRGGKALYDAAVSRPEPIPVYAEMGSINPIFVLPGALRERSEEVAKGLAASVTLGVGQFCTNPGLVVYPESDHADKFLKTITDIFRQQNAGTMLTPIIQKAYNDGIVRMAEQTGVQVLSHGEGIETNEKVHGHNRGIPYALHTTSAHFLSNPALEEEVFGPSTLIVTAKSMDDMLAIAGNMKGHLTASLHGTEEDLQKHTELINILRRKVGRLIFNGFPTGVEVSHSMVHGGPFPATTDSRMTSVGTRAIYRFTRPVCYQNFPDTMLPDALKNANPLRIWRLVDGEMRK
jgi:2,5-dioxopentanoate dehydrogenase